MSVTNVNVYKIADYYVAIHCQEDDELWDNIPQYEPFQLNPYVNQGELAKAYASDKFIFNIKPVKAAENSAPKIPSEKYKVTTIVQDGWSMDVYKNINYFFVFHSDFDKNGWCTLNFSESNIEDIEGYLFTSCCSLSMRMLCFNNAMMLLCSYFGAQDGILLFHSSVVVKDDKGYMFLGKSGTGKSTHSKLWLNNIEGTSLLNDDNPAVRIFPDGTVKVYGSPWSGKTSCYKNFGVPVAGCVRLWQASETKIKKLSTVEAYAALFPTVSFMKWEKEIADNVSKSLNVFIEKVPVYSLWNRPEKEAALLVYNTINKIIPPPEPKKKVVPNEILLDEVKDLINEGHPVIIKVRGNSMLPFIIGDKDSVRLIYKASYKVGDIVLAEVSKGHYVLHRIFSMFGNRVTLMGDGNINIYEHCKISDIVAGVDVIYHNGVEKSPYKKFTETQVQVWKKMHPIRRWLLAVYRRTLYKFQKK
jgi:hypothetical protein